MAPFKQKVFIIYPPLIGRPRQLPVTLLLLKSAKILTLHNISALRLDELAIEDEPESVKDIDAIWTPAERIHYLILPSLELYNIADLRIDSPLLIDLRR